MSMISEQVKHLLKIADRTQNEAFFCEWYNGYVKDLRQAADTIEALSTKLQAANVEQPSHIMKNDTFTKIITALDERIGAEWRIIAGLNDETQIYGCTRSLEAYQQSKLIVEQNIDEYKERQSEMDYGSGWIVCEDALPERGGTYIVTAKENKLFHVTFVKWQSKYKRWDLTGARSYWNVIAWQPLPEPYCPQS